MGDTSFRFDTPPVAPIPTRTQRAEFPSPAVHALAPTKLAAKRRGMFLLAALSSLLIPVGVGRAAEPSWVAIWATAPIEEAPAPEFQGKDLVLRQVVRISGASETVRLRISNEYGSEPLVLEDVHLAVAGPEGTIRRETDKSVRFDGESRTSIPPRSTLVSDPVAFPASAEADLAVSARMISLPGKMAGHPGSRSTSYLKPGASPGDRSLDGAAQIVHWYFLVGIDAVANGPDRAAIDCFGDSITDGHGCPTDQNARWTDALTRRLQANPASAGISALNLGIGGNRLLRPGIGPPGLDRLPRDVLGQPGVRWVILQLGVNDLGTRIKAKAAGLPYASAQDIIAGYRQVLSECRAHGILVALATITPCANATWYSTPESEADRKTINQWIRNAPCDRVVDFDAALRDPDHPDVLLPAFDSGDHLHPSLSGYRQMAEAVPLDFFRQSRGSK